jgi:hypothetical protein
MVMNSSPVEVVAKIILEAVTSKNPDFDISQVKI